MRKVNLLKSRMFLLIAGILFSLALISKANAQCAGYYFSGATQVCPGEAVNYFVSNGNTSGCSIVSVDGGGTISGSTVTWGSVSGNYEVEFQCSCGIAYGTVTVLPTTLSGGTVTDATICEGETNVSLTLNNNSPFITGWQEKFPSESWSEADHIDFTGSVLTEGYIDKTTTKNYRAIIDNQCTAEVYSSPGTVTVTPLPTVEPLGNLHLCPGVPKVFTATSYISSLPATSSVTFQMYTVYPNGSLGPWIENAPTTLNPTGNVYTASFSSSSVTYEGTYAFRAVLDGCAGPFTNASYSVNTPGSPGETLFYFNGFSSGPANSINVCDGESFTVNTSGPNYGDVKWYGPGLDANNPPTGSQRTISPPNGPGTKIYTVTGIFKHECGNEYPLSTDFTVYQTSPSASISNSNLHFCNDDAGTLNLSITPQPTSVVSYQWYVDGILSGTSSTYPITSLSPARHNIYATVTASYSNSCIGNVVLTTETKEVIVSPKPPQMLPGTPTFTFCAGDPLSINVSGDIPGVDNSVVFHLLNSSLQVVSTDNSPNNPTGSVYQATLVPTSAGLHYVRAVVDGICQGSDEPINIVVTSPGPVPGVLFYFNGFGSPATSITICEGESVDVNISGPTSSATWIGSDGYSFSGSSTTITPVGTGTKLYTISGQFIDNCGNLHPISSSFDIVVNAAPTVSIENTDLSFCMNETLPPVALYLTSGGTDVSYRWNVNNIWSSETGSSFPLATLSAGSYSIYAEVTASYDFLCNSEQILLSPAKTFVLTPVTVSGTAAPSAYVLCGNPGSTTINLTVTGQTGKVKYWEYQFKDGAEATYGNTWDCVQGDCSTFGVTTDVNYQTFDAQPGNGQVRYYRFRALVQSGTDCNPIWTPPSTELRVDPPLDPSMSLSGAADHYGVGSGDLTVQNLSGNISAWTYSVPANPNTWLPISNLPNSVLLSQQETVLSYINIVEDVTFKVDVDAGNCGSASFEALIDIYPEPVVDFFGQLSIPYGGSTRLYTYDEYGTFQWIKDDIDIPGATEYEVTINEPGEYSIRVTTTNGESKTSGSRSIKSSLDAQFEAVNYIQEITLLKEGITTSANLYNLYPEEISMNMTYFDGLGRNLQSVGIGASPDGQDIITPVEYDEYGREVKSFVPYVLPLRDGRYRPEALKSSTSGLYDEGEQYDFFQSAAVIDGQDEERPFTETSFEPSPLNRPISSMGAGQDWYLNNKAVTYGYLSNTHGSAAGEEYVISWEVNSSGMPVRAAALTGYVETGGYYASAQLSVSSIKDEEGREVREYKDKLGRVILKKVQAVTGTPQTYTSANWAQTYYIYDDLGNLRYVLQPNLSQQLHNDADNPTQTELNELAFQYTYDERRRMITKQVPGAGQVYMIYDKRDRLVMTQDAVQRGNFEWMYTKYDQLNRPIITGIYTHGSLVDRATMAGNISTTAFSESYDGTAATFGYTNTLFPTTGTKVLTVTYYDNYNFQTLISGNDENFVPGELTGQEAAFDRVTGQVTGSQTNILGTTSYLWSAAYYDDRYRTIQSISQNHLGGYDRATNAYDFAGRVTESLTTHVKGPATTTVKRRFAYDHAGRLTKVWHKVGTEDEVLLVHNLYDELGRLKRKALYGANADAGGAPFKKGDNQYGYDIEVSQYKNEKKIVARNSVKLLPGFSFKAENGKTLTVKIDDEEVKAAAAKLTASGYQAVDYRYNIRGWLERINKSNLSQEESGDPVDYFGMNLGYQKALSGTNNSPTWNGNISATRWSVNLGLAKNNPYLIPEFDERAYKYSYDAMNRLTAATHRVKTTVWGGSGSLHENGITYDLNGNIKTLVRKSAFNEGIDNLAYTYNTGNKLMKVADSDDATKGFIDGANSGDDYAYDPNGNMVQDLNKSINSGGIVYNHLNLPSEVNKTTNEKIEYLYDASGRKLQQKVYNTSSQLIKTTDYDGEFVYEGNLQFILHEEGRYLPSGEYEYFIKDHLGNNRMTFTTQPDFDDYLVTYESSTDGNAFDPSYADANIMSGTNHTPGGNHAQRLSGMLEDPSYPGKNLMVGLAKSFPVVPGDTINVEVQAMYVGSEGSGSDVEDLLFSGIAAAFGVSAASTGDGKILYDNLGNVNGETYFAKNGDDNGSAPDAYLNYILFDKDYVFYDLGFIPISTAANATWERLAVDIFPRQPGFVYIYLSNENDNIIDVFFDDLKIDYHHSPVVQADDYYPFGLAFNSYQSGLKNDYLYNDGTERVDELDLDVDFTAFRTYDPQIGRWWQPDLVYKYHESPYAWVTNNPIRFNDPLGLDTLQEVVVTAKRIPSSSNNALLFPPASPLLQPVAPPKSLPASPLVIGPTLLAGALTAIFVAIPTSMGKDDAWTQEDGDELQKLLNKKSTGPLSDQEKRDLERLLDKAQKFSTGPFASQIVLRNTILQKFAGHIFRNEPGHFPNDTGANRALLEDVANDSNAYLGPDKYGNDWHARTQKDGSQIWTQTRNGSIFNGGRNETPRTYNSETGLSSPTIPRN